MYLIYGGLHTSTLARNNSSKNPKGYLLFSYLMMALAMMMMMRLRMMMTMLMLMPMEVVFALLFFVEIATLRMSEGKKSQKCCSCCRHLPTEKINRSHLHILKNIKSRTSNWQWQHRNGELGKGVHPTCFLGCIGKIHLFIKNKSYLTQP